MLKENFHDKSHEDTKYIVHKGKVFKVVFPWKMAIITNPAKHLP